MIFLIFSLIFMIVTAQILAFIFKKLQIPSVLGELSAGVILGPSFLGFITPSPILNLLAEVSVVLLLFEVGLHTDLSRLLSTGKKPVVVAFMGFVLPIALGFIVARYFGIHDLPALFIGGALSATSIGISVRVLADLGQHNSHEAHIVLGAAIVDDLFGVLLLAFLYNFASTASIQIPALLLLTLGTLVIVFVAPLFVKISFWMITQICPTKIYPTLLLLMSLGLISLLSYVAHWVGAPMIIGGFSAGIALSRQFGFQLNRLKFLNRFLRAENIYFNHLEKSIQPLNFCLVPIFFVMVGVSLNLKDLPISSPLFWGLSLSLLAIAFISKFTAGFFIQEPRRLQSLIGISMIPRGEVGLIFASMGLMSGVLSNDVYACLVLVIALTTFAPPLLLKFLYRSTL